MGLPKYVKVDPKRMYRGLVLPYTLGENGCCEMCVECAVGDVGTLGSVSVFSPGVPLRVFLHPSPFCMAGAPSVKRLFRENDTLRRQTVA